MAINDRVRVGQGKDGTIVVLGAWCPRCREESMPTPEGACSWCGKPIVDEGSLPSREMLAQLRPPTSPPAPVAPARGPGQPTVWTRATIVAAIRAHAERTGYIPFRGELSGPSTSERPNWQVAVRLFGNWGNAIEAAGYPRPLARSSKRISLASLTGAAEEGPSQERMSTNDGSSAPSAEQNGVRDGLPEPAATEPDQGRGESRSAAIPGTLPSPPAPPPLGEALRDLIRSVRVVLDALERELTLQTNATAGEVVRLVIDRLGDGAA